MHDALPRYVVARNRGGRLVYYWQVPRQFRAKVGNEIWPDGVERLPDDSEKMLARAKRLNLELDQLRAGISPDNRKGTMPWLIASYERSSKFLEKRPRTQRSYQQLSRYLHAWSSERGHPTIAALSTPKILEFLARFDDRPSLRNHIGTYTRLLLAHARRIGEVADNPARELGLSKAKRKKKIRVVDVKQVLELVAKADDLGLNFVGTGVLLHFDLGQRQADLLRLQKPRDYRDGLFQFHQSKTGQIVTLVPFLDETRARLAALPDSRLMIVAGPNGLAVSEDHYRKSFRKVADACGFDDLWEMELRHSCVIFCERAGLTPAEIATRTGHSLKTVYTILESYRFRDPVVAQNGAIKLAAYHKKLTAL